MSANITNNNVTAKYTVNATQVRVVSINSAIPMISTITNGVQAVLLIGHVSKTEYANFLNKVFTNVITIVKARPGKCI